MAKKSSRSGQRREREKQKRLQSIRIAALHVFAEQGYKRSSMERIADQAELGKATLYYYFKTKQELFADILAGQLDLLEEHLQALDLDRADPVDAAENLCREWVQHFQKQPELASLLHPFMAAGQTQVEKQLGPELAAQIGKAHKPLVMALQPIAEQFPAAKAMSALLLTLLIGLAGKIADGNKLQRRIKAQDELDLFFTMLRHMTSSTLENHNA